MIGHCPACNDDAILTVRDDGQTRCGWCHAEWQPGQPAKSRSEVVSDNRLSRARHAQLLRQRDCLPWREVAIRAGYSSGVTARQAVVRLDRRLAA